ncbi:MAG TPA: O-antigen ligase family protein [Acidimicrobiales bacterium]|nr:O-antigen ligase family protein [Acidimicrobiales bacterium]
MATTGPRPRLLARTLGSLPLVAVSVLLVNATEPVLPAPTLLWRITPARLVFLVGFAALLASGVRLGDFRTRLDVPIGLLLVAAAASILHGGFSPAPLQVLVEDVALYYLTVGCLRRNPDALQGLSVAAFAAVTITAIVALHQVSQHVNTTFCRAFFTDVPCAPGRLIRATGTFSNPNVMAPDVLLLGPLAALVPGQVGDRWSRLALGGLLAAGYAGLVVTYSRGAYLGAVAAGGAVGLAMIYRRGAWRRAYTWALAIGAVLAAAAFGTGLVGRLGERNLIWSRAVALARRHLATGVGVGHTRQALGTAHGVPLYHAHNLWLDWLLAAGVVGLIAIIAITAVSLRAAIRSSLAGSPAALASLTGFYVVSLVDDPAYLHRIAATWWLVLAVTMAERPRSRRRGGLRRWPELEPR